MNMFETVAFIIMDLIGGNIFENAMHRETHPRNTLGLGSSRSFLGESIERVAKLRWMFLSVLLECKIVFFMRK